MQAHRPRTRDIDNLSRLTNSGASPSGKAAAFGAAIVGSNPTAPASVTSGIAINLKIRVENPPTLTRTEQFAQAIQSLATRTAPAAQPLVIIRFMSCAQISRLVHEHKGKRGPTNILTFRGDSNGDSADIAICPAIAAEDAQVRGWSTENELIYLVIHGTLHALGFDHSEPREARRMRALECQILTDTGIDPAPLGKMDA